MTLQVVAGNHLAALYKQGKVYKFKTLERKSASWQVAADA